MIQTAVVSIARQRAGQRAKLVVTAVIGGCVLVLLMVGCASEGAVGVEFSLEGDQVTFTSDVRQLLESDLGDADSSQLEILSKGQVSFEDYEAAFGRAVDCGRRLGYEVEVQLDESDGFRFLQLGIVPPGEDPGSEAAMFEWDDCYRRYVAAVDKAWQLGHSDLRAAAELTRWKSLVECIAANGGATHPSDPEPLTGEERAQIFEESRELQTLTGTNCVEQAGY